jgi:thiol:disulfide interchange protein DsbD
MKYRFTLLILFALALWQEVSAQDSSAAVRWEFSGARDVLILHARISEGWRLYSTTMKDDLPNSRITLDSSARTGIGRIEEKGQLEVKKEAVLDNAETRVFEKSVDLVVHLKPGYSGPADLKGAISYMAALKDSFVGPIEVKFKYGLNNSGELVARNAGLQESVAGAGELKRSTIHLENPVNSCGGTGTEKAQGLLSIFLLGMLGGLFGLIMPCTFPMIPLTVSFFTKRATSRKQGISNAFFYGFCIFIIYVLISLPFYFLPASQVSILNNISTNIWLNLLFAAVFFAFALSFFGLFEITLPSSFSNSVDSKSSITSKGGIFFMALTLVIVSFSCTGPLLGTLLVGALSGGAIQLTVAMAGFGLALGLPFALFALFPNWLQSLPRSGSWMNTVKIFFGFVELALALKYFSNADLVKQWGLLKRETFFGIWIAISLALALYLLGVIKFKHDPPPAKLSKGRILTGLLFIALAIYLAPGITDTKYANRALISGFPPPLTYSLYKHTGETKGVEPVVINDYEKALKIAREQHKPILIDFTGWACVNCRRMEENVWPKEGVKELIRKDFILVSLYVDDKKNLPEDQQFLFTTGDGSKKNIVTVGDKFATLQSENFKNASQPLYVIVSPDEQLMNRPVGYTPSVKEYADWLRCGLDAFHSQQPATSAR